MLEIFLWWLQLGRDFLSAEPRERQRGRNRDIYPHLPGVPARVGIHFSLLLEQAQAEEVRSQAGLTEVVFHRFKKIKSKHTFKASLENNYMK